METEKISKKAEAYDQIIKTLKKCSSSTKREFIEEFTDQDLNPL